MERRLQRYEEEIVTVFDDLDDIPLNSAELDAVEGFLMPLIEELLNGNKPQAGYDDSEAPQNSRI